MKKIIPILLLFLLAGAHRSMAQCAVCKTTIVNNVSNGELALAEGLNFGIMYLFFSPYLAVAAIGLVWFIKSRKHVKNLSKSNT